MKKSELIEKLKNVPEDYDIRMCVTNGNGHIRNDFSGNEFICNDFTKDIEVDIYEEDKIVEICGL